MFVYLSVVQPLLDLIHLAILDGVHDVEVFHNDRHITDDVPENRSADDHSHDRESSFKIAGAGDVTVPHRGPEGMIAAPESGFCSSYLAGKRHTIGKRPETRTTTEARYPTALGKHNKVHYISEETFARRACKTRGCAERSFCQSREGTPLRNIKLNVPEWRHDHSSTCAPRRRHFSPSPLYIERYSVPQSGCSVKHGKLRSCRVNKKVLENSAKALLNVSSVHRFAATGSQATSNARLVLAAGM